MKGAWGAALLLTFCAAAQLACGAGRPRLRLHGWPDDVDLVEILETMVEDPAMGVRYAPALERTENGRTTPVPDPSAELRPYRALIKEAASPPRDATPRSLRCDATALRCGVDEGGQRTTFFFARGPHDARYLLLERIDIRPR